MSADEFTLEYPNDSITSYEVAYHIVNQAIESHDDQWEVYRAIRDHIGGKKPKDPEKLRKQGLSWSSNYNFGKARSQIERGVAELTKKVTDAMAIGVPEFRLPKEDDRSNDFLNFLHDFNNRSRVATTLGYAFSRAIEEAGDLYNLINNVEFNSYTYGFAPVSWGSKDWMPESKSLTDIAFRPGSTPKDIQTWVIFKSESASDLYKTYTRIKNNSSSVKTYWNVDVLEEVLTQLYSSRTANGGKHETWGKVLEDYHADAAGVIARTEDLNLACIYQVESDGSVSEVLIPWGHEFRKEAEEVGNHARARDILYKRKWENKSWEEFLCIIRDSGFSEDGSIHDMRGIGKIATENSIRYNRLRNNINDKAQLVGAPMFEQPSTQTAEKFKITMSSGFSILPPGFTPLEKQPNYDIQSHLLIVGHEDKEFQELTTHFRNDASGKLSSRPTKDEVQLAGEEMARIKSAKDRVKLQDYSALFFRCLKKMTANLNNNHSGYAAQQKLFKLVKEAIPEVAKDDEDVKKLIDLVDSYSIDMINMDLGSLQMALQMAETPFARNRIKRMILIAKGFSVREVNMQVPVIVDRFRAFDDHRVALIENDMFWTTSQIAFQDSDDHITHFEVHAEKMEEVFDLTRQQQLDVVKVYEFCVRLFEHMNLHVESLIEDPVLKDQAEEYSDKMNSYKNLIYQISYAKDQELQRRQQEQEQENPGISPKDRHDMRLEAEKAIAQEQRNQFKTRQRGELKEQEMANRHEENLREIDLDHKRELEKIRNKRIQDRARDQ